MPKILVAVTHWVVLDTDALGESDPDSLANIAGGSVQFRPLPGLPGITLKRPPTVVSVGEDK